MKQINKRINGVLNLKDINMKTLAYNIDHITFALWKDNTMLDKYELAELNELMDSIYNTILLEVGGLQ